jgi:riboflavin synthase
MFSGIVQSTKPISAITMGSDAGSIQVNMGEDLTRGLCEGASVAIDGVCLTATSINQGHVTFDVIWSTLTRTILPHYAIGRLVNVERSLTMNSENGGHEVSGHVDCTATVISKLTSTGNTCITFSAPSEKMRYLFPLGFISINGVSLTLSEVTKNERSFSVWLIPETLRRTNLDALTIGDHVNLEFHKGTQVMVDTINEAIERVVTQAIRDGSLSVDQLPTFLKNAQPLLDGGLARVRTN